MTRFLLVAALLVIAVSGQAQQGGEALGRALDALRAGDWSEARRVARTDGPVASDVIAWHALRAGRGDARQVQDFLARNPDWPGLPFLREKSEAAMADADPDAVRRFFDAESPRTGTGALALARAHRAAGEEGAAQAGIVLAWRTLSLNAEERAAFLRDWGAVLAPHHTARLDMALWNGWTVNAGAMLPLVDAGWRRLAEARLGLRNEAAGVDAMIEAVPGARADDAGLAYERFRWRVSKGRQSAAIALLLERSSSAEALGEPWAWARARRSLARDRMRDGAYAEAYRIASRHFLVDGSSFADLEWLSGYLALRHLDDPEQATRHFTRFREAVWTPISVGRAGYWLGRAHEEAGRAEAALEAFAEGARFQTSFYGLLAAERAGIAPYPALSGQERFGPWREAEFTQSTVFDAAMLLLEAGETALAERFFTHLAESLDREGMGQMGDMLIEMDRPHLQVMLGKRAAQFGHEIPGPYFALHDVIVEDDYPVERALVHAIARRESEFDPMVISGAGARGFMQLMPGTARDVSGWLGLGYSRSRLLSDPGYNAVLGAEYLAFLSRRFDGNVVMMAAGYNAGPARPERWVARFGNPLRGEIDVIDWIESIPFDETRNYVMRVAESLPVYRARLGRDPHPVPFSQELIGNTLSAVETQ